MKTFFKQLADWLYERDQPISPQPTPITVNTAPAETYPGTIAVSDPSAEKQVRQLFERLRDIQGKQILFGKQDEFLVGANHPRGTGGSDTYDMIGAYPALVGYDLCGLEQGKERNRSNLRFDNIKKTIVEQHERGAVITLMWSVDNPFSPVEGHRVSGKNYAIRNLAAVDDAPLMRYHEWLDKLAYFFNNLKTASGELIPVIFRPFHECTGSWFWWGAGCNTAKEYISLYEYTVDYLRTKGVHNLLYAYCTGGIRSKEHLLERYPGKDYVDIICADKYADVDKADIYQNLKQITTLLTSVAIQHGKIAAIAETGFRNMNTKSWWTQTLFPSIKDSGIAYIMLWGNYGLAKNNWAAWAKCKSEADFIQFAQKKKIKFLK